MPFFSTYTITLCFDANKIISINVILLRAYQMSGTLSHIYRTNNTTQLTVGHENSYDQLCDYMGYGNCIMTTA